MARKRKARGLKVLRPNVAGIDVGSEQHWVCGCEDESGNRPVRVFGATTADLYDMAHWLLEQGVESVAMESTYLYWIPIYEVLEEAGLEVVLVNARALRNVPGRKTDMLDCQWLQLLHACGLLRGSFRPSDHICRLRALQRQRGNLIEERTRHVQWMQKALDQMNVRVHRAVTDLTGVTGLRIVRAIVDGERDPVRLAQHRDKRCKLSEAEIARQLTGTWREEHLFNLQMALRLFDEVERAIASYDERLMTEVEALQPEERRQEPCPPHPKPSKQRTILRRGDQDLRTALWRFSGVDLTTVDGINAQTAQLILTEVGIDMAAFPTEKDFISWLRLCPRKPISGGKPVKKKRSNGMGASRLCAAFRMAAVSVQRTKTALGAFYRRKARARSGAIAVAAVARKLAQYVYRLLRFGRPYFDEGQERYEERFRQRQLAALKATARDLGFCLLPADQTST